MNHVIAVDGPPLSHCYEATVLVSAPDAASPTRIGEFRNGVFSEIPGSEFDLLLTEQRVFRLVPPLPIPNEPSTQDGSPLALVATAKLLRLTRTNAGPWSQLDVPASVREDQGISAVEPADREWHVWIASPADLRRIRSEWFETLKSIARESIQDYLSAPDNNASLEQAIEAAELASEAAWMDDRSVRVASEYLGLAYSFREPEKTRRVHKFLTYRFPDWTWDQFFAEMSKLKDTLLMNRRDERTRHKWPATQGSRVALKFRGPSPRAEFFCTEAAGR